MTNIRYLIRPRALACLGLLLMPLPTIFAQTATAGTETKTADNDRAYQLSTLTVTSVNRTGKAIDRIPGAVNLIQNADVQQNLVLTEDVTKVLEHSIPGYSPSREGRFTFGETLRGRRPLYLLDGIPQSTPLRDGSIGAYFIDLSLVERVEIINGPSATEGLGAAGGVINYITKHPRKGANEIGFDTKISSQFHGNNPGWRASINFTHSQNEFDILAGAAFASREPDYDGHGKLMGVDNFDTFGRNFFVKLGHTFGANDAQRIQLMVNRFDYVDNGRYIAVDGNRALNLPNSGRPGVPLGRPQNQIMKHATLEYSHDDIFGGKFRLQLFRDRQNALNPASIDPSKQDVTIAPIGTLVDQSEITAKKHGVRSIFVRQDFLVQGLELDVGADYLYDETAQGLALTNRVWVPPLKYSSLAPFAQLEYEYGPFTIRGGARSENADLEVDTFKTIAPANTVVQGGKLSFTQTLYNIGGIYRMGRGWSVYAAYSEGFGVPDVGRALRGINVPNQSLETRGNLTPLIITNKEAGLNWRGKRGSIGGSVYESYAPLGSSLAFDAATQTAVVSRTPTRVKGLELTGEAKIAKGLTFTAIYSRIIGKTSLGAGLPLVIDMTADQIPPPKTVGVLRWTPSENTNLNLTATNYRDRHVNFGVRSLTNANLQEDFDGYTLVDFTLQYRTKRFGTWTLGVENLFNTFYIQAISSSSVNQGTGSLTYYLSGRGRAVALSNSIKF